MQYKVSTQQTLNYIERIENYLRSENYRNQIWWQDINTQASPYKYNNEQTLGESIELMQLGFLKLKENIDIYDKWNFDQRNSINNSYLNNIASWIESNPIWNWQSIIQNINAFITTLGYLWIQIGSDSGKNKDYKSFSKRLWQAEEFIRKTNEVSELFDKLKPISEAIPSTESFLDIKTKNEEISKIHKNIKQIEDSTTESKKSIEENARNSWIMLWEISADIIAKYFHELASDYKKSIEEPGWWNHQFILALLLFILNLIMVIFYKENTYTLINLNEEFIKKIGSENINFGIIFLEVMKIISNGIIRVILISPSVIFLWFTLKNRDDKEKIRKTYEFRSNAIRTLSWQFEQLKQQDISQDKRWEFFVGVLTKLYTEPLEKWGKESEGSLLGNLKDTTDIMQKMKDLFK